MQLASQLGYSLRACSSPNPAGRFADEVNYAPKTYHRLSRSKHACSPYTTAPFAGFALMNINHIRHHIYCRNVSLDINSGQNFVWATEPMTQIQATQMDRLFVWAGSLFSLSSSSPTYLPNLSVKMFFSPPFGKKLSRCFWHVIDE